MPWTDNTLPPGWVRHTLAVADPNFGSVNRSYIAASIEEQLQEELPLRSPPLLLVFHGQWGRPRMMAESQYGYLRSLQQAGWLTVAPAGIADSDTDPTDSGWNVGTNGKDANGTCLPRTNNTGCHLSCLRLGGCGRCAWSSCYDDVAFVRTLIDNLIATRKVDRRRVFLLGTSNGGMFVHYLSQQMVGAFRAIVSLYALPLSGYAAGQHSQLLRSKASRHTSVLMLNPVNDTIIPVHGGRSRDGWLYVSAWEEASVWARVHQCSPALVPTTIGFEAPTAAPYCPLLPRYARLKLQECVEGLQCYEHPGCADRQEVRLCLYSGEHGMWPPPQASDLLILNFLDRHDDVEVNADLAYATAPAPAAVASPLATGASPQATGGAALLSGCVLAAAVMHKSLASLRRRALGRPGLELH